MDSEKIGKIIKEVRLKANLSQQKFADKYGVTYQAVSKWETGKNIPDIVILKRISDDFGIKFDELLEGNYALEVKNKKDKRKLIVFFILFFLFCILAFVCIFFFLSQDNDFKFKTLFAGCDNFTISGSLAYNASKSSIYISEVNYCGNDDNTNYNYIECSLYEEINNVKTLITTCDRNTNVTLEEFLKDVKLGVDDYKQNCRNYVNNKLYLEISAIDENNKKIVYEVPLKLKDNCQF